MELELLKVSNLLPEFFHTFCINFSQINMTKKLPTRIRTQSSRPKLEVKRIPLLTCSKQVI